MDYSLPINQQLPTTAWCDRDEGYCKAPDNLNNDQHYISKVRINGILYSLRCEIVEVHPLTCTKCGSPLELHNGHGRCDYCGTSYSAVMSIVEDK